jgi:hypothetical protein
MASFTRTRGKLPVASQIEGDAIESIRKVLTSLGGEHARLNDRVTSEWESAPDFLPLVLNPGDGRIALEVWLTGSEHDRMKWHSVNEGQEERLIEASGQDMVYRPGYKASTSYRKIASKKHTRYGQTRRAQQVQHTQEARDIEPEVNSRITKKADKQVESAIWQSFKRML